MSWSRCSLTALAGLVILAILGTAGRAVAQTPAATGPITIGVLAPSTGPFATYARDIIDGARLYSDEVGGQLGRRKLEMVVEDYQTRRAAIIASDSVGPLELMMAWARAFEESGGKIVQEIYPPLGTADMAPWVAKLRQDVDVIGVQTVGADGVRFVKQFQEYGLKGKIPVVDASVGVSEISLLPTAGEAAVGVYNSQPYQYTVDTPRNRKFVQAFRAKFGRDPGSPAAFTYAAMAALDAAVNATGGHTEDSARFLEALRKTDLEAPQGRVRFDRFQNGVTDIHISRIEKVGDQIQPVVIETIRGVDQFLGMDPAEYLKKPRLVTLKGSFAK